MGEGRGPFWGAIDVAEGRTLERVPPAVVAALAAQAGGEAFVALDAENGRAAVRTFAAGADAEKPTVVYEAALDSLAALPAASLPRAEIFRALAEVAAALRAVHAQGRAHGVLRPEMIRVGAAGGVTLLLPAREVDAHALHVAAVTSGAIDLAASAFVAPEVLAGGKATPASDVYALAACAYHALTGELPFGQVDVRRAAFGAPDWAAATLHQALLAAPLARPAVDAFEYALRAVAASFASPAAVPPPPRPAPSKPDVSAILVLVLVVGGIFVLTGALWLVAMTWDAMGEAGHFALLLLLSGGVLAAGEVCRAKRLERAGLALTTIGTQLLWSDAAYVLTVYFKDAGEGSWSLVSALIAATTLGFALHRKSSLLATVAAFDCVIVAGCFGAYVSTGEPLGPTLYAAMVAAAYATIAGGADRVAGRGVGVPFAAFAILSAGLSALLGLLLLAGDHARLFATSWPYVVMVALALPALSRLRAPYGALFAVAALLLLASVPTVEALLEPDDLLYLAAAIGIGAAAATAAFVTPPFNGDGGQQIGMTCVGVVSVIGAPGFLALVHLDDAKHSLYLAIALGVSALLVALSYALSARAASKSAYRVLEAAGLLLFFGLLTVDSVANLKSWTYPGILVLGATTVLFLGALTKRAALVAIASAALLLNIWIQYFGKLEEYVPVSLLCVGFGIALLVGGVLFEKTMRPLLPAMRAWA